MVEASGDRTEREEMSQVDTLSCDKPLVELKFQVQVYLPARLYTTAFPSYFFIDAITIYFLIHIDCIY